MTRAREGLAEVSHAVEAFIDREFTRLLHHSPGWKRRPLAPCQVRVASNLIEITLPQDGRQAAVLRFEEQSGWLVASVARIGWISELNPTERSLFGLALTGLYKRAGVDLVREHLAVHLGPIQAYDIADEGLVVWPGPGYDTRYVRSLHDEASEAIMFRGRQLQWAQWVAWCDAPRHGGTTPDAPLGRVLPSMPAP